MLTKIWIIFVWFCQAKLKWWQLWWYITEMTNNMGIRKGRMQAPYEEQVHDIKPKKTLIFVVSVMRT
jgi:hypothetical protein